MGVSVGIQIVVGAPWEGPDSYRTTVKVAKKCSCGKTGDKTKFCADCGESFGEDVEGYDFSSISAELSQAFDEEFEKYGEDVFYEGDLTDSDGFGMVRLRSYNGDGAWVLGYEVCDVYSYGSEETDVSSGSALISLIHKARGKMDQYNLGTGDVKVFSHLYYS